MSKVLTELELRAIVRAAAEAGSSVDVRDGGCPGLEMRAGARKATWRLKYTDRRTHRVERVVIGYYPAVGLSEARRRAKEAQARIEDPLVRASPARDRRERIEGITFRQLAEKRLAEAGARRGLGPRTRAYYEWCLEKHAYGAIGDMAACDVRPEDVISIVDAVAAGGALVTADRVRSAIGSVYTWAVQRRLATSNPTRGLEKRASSLSRERVMDDAEIGLVLRGIEESDASVDMKAILRLLLLTGQRSTEVREAEAAELREGYTPVGAARFAGPVWVIPGDRLVRGRKSGGRTKNGRQQVLPLSDQAAALFRSAADGKDGRLFDVSERQAVSRAMARICGRIDLKGEMAVTPHDFRRTCATWLGGAGFRPDVVEAVLNHAPQGVTRRVYDLSRLLPLLREAMQAWADHLMRVNSVG